MMLRASLEMVPGSRSLLMNMHAPPSWIKATRIEQRLFGVASAFFVLVLIFFSCCSGDNRNPSASAGIPSASRIRLPLVIWHNQTDVPNSPLRISIMPSDGIADSFPRDQRYPMRGFVFANVEGTLCAFASKDIVGARMPGIFSETDVWVPLTKDGEILMRYVPDGIMGFQSPIIRHFKGNRVLAVRMPIMREHDAGNGKSEWCAIVSEITLHPDENGRGFQEKLEENGQPYYQYEAYSDQSPTQFPPERHWIGNGVYRKGVKVAKDPWSPHADVLVGIVTRCTISATAVSSKIKAVIRVVPLPVKEDKALDDALDAASATMIPDASLSTAK